jgi:predicted AAA+ superfamily ATPase
LKYGGYPGAYLFVGTDEWRRYVSTSIISTVIEKDILQFQTVRNPALFKQAFEILMAYPAMEISYTKLLGQLQNKGNVEIIKHYIDLYQGAYLIKALEKYSPNKIKVKSSSPKILPLAPCLYYLTHLDSYSAEERGRVFEAIVGAQLARTGEELFYWRDGKHEVDFVLRRGKKVWAIEVKSGRRRIGSGLAAFTDRFPGAKTAIITIDDYDRFEADPIAYLLA